MLRRNKSVCSANDWTDRTSLPRRRGDVTKSLRFPLFLFRLRTNCRWCDQELKIDILTPQLSEIFLEQVELHVDRFARNLQFRPAVMQSRASVYGDSLVEEGCCFHSYVGFIGWTKIRIEQSRGHVTIQEACYSGHKRMHYLIYQTISGMDCLIIAIYGLV